IENFGQVKIQNLYNGIDAVFSPTADGKLEYSFVVHAGADPSKIQLKFQGADSITTDAAGDVVLHTEAGDVTESAPVFVQPAQGPAGAATKSTISGGYVVNADSSVGIQVGSYDSSRDLTIDPILGWSTTFGTSASGVAADAAGNSYVVGTALGGHVLVQKYAPFGGLIFSTTLSGSGTDTGNAIAVDPAGNIYVTGQTTSSNFPLFLPYHATPSRPP